MGTWSIIPCEHNRFTGLFLLCIIYKVKECEYYSTRCLSRTLRYKELTSDSVKGKVNGHGRRLIRNGELVLVMGNSRSHWNCISLRVKKMIKKQFLGQNQLTGFHDLSLEDKLRVVKAIGWPRESIANYIEKDELDTFGSEYRNTSRRLSGSQSEGDGSVMPPSSSRRKLGAQHAKDLVNAVGGLTVVEYVFLQRYAPGFSSA